MPFDEKEYQKEYRLKNKEKMKEYQKEYYKNNKEKINLLCKEYSEINKDKLILYQKEYKKNNPESKRKTDIISNWKRMGVICEDYDKLYEYYLSSEECENCGIQLNSGTGTKKHLDHCHNTGLFRNILCQTCNLLRY